jgi:cytoskeletal protein RodZ
VSFEEAVEATKISPNNLRALEEDDYGNLPADAFVRGFYGIYAKFLSLDADEVRNRYSQQRKTLPKKNTHQPPTPTQLAIETSSMAERPSVTSHSLVGLSLLVIFVVGAAICWYLSWNPATYISQKLRGVPEPAPVSTQQTAPVVQQETQPANDSATSEAVTVSPPPASPSENAAKPAPEPDGAGKAVTEELAQEKPTAVQPIVAIATPGATPALQEKVSAAPAGSTTGSVQQKPVSAEKQAQPSAAASAVYILKASFKEATRLTVKVDDQPAEHLSFAAGTSQSWSANKSIVISLPSVTSATLTLNDLPLALPKKPAGQELSISIPEYLLE